MQKRELLVQLGIAAALVVTTALVTTIFVRADAPAQGAADSEASARDESKTDASKADKRKKKKNKKKQDDEAAPDHTCNICGHTGKFGAFARRPEANCPKCGSRERHRLLMFYLQNESALSRDKLDVLHFSPQKGERDLLRSWPNLNYHTASYYPDWEELRLDLTALELPDESWDVLIVYHILEHIIEDQKAMREMYRVLRPGGQVILQVPIEVGRTELYEDASITDPKQRTKHFGQHDHVRKYSERGLRERLEAAGFVVEPVDYQAKLDPAVLEKHSLKGRWRTPLDERIWLAKKPARTEPAETEPGKQASAKKEPARSKKTP